ncbi:stage II sporulation protein P [Halalkalibacter okhensis]|uniref:stage II sporulation protein P n=1 Tax=Halalkalibacter okhensis TaxID=333138 RepID=UPI00068BFC59|nr:stage II sporulation protein P [Halalkalibacter okhensis]
MNKKDETDLLRELKRKHSDISPDSDFAEELEGKLVKHFVKKHKKNVFFPMLSLATVSVLFFMLILSYMTFEGVSGVSISKNPEVYIYHTHDTESYLPELQDGLPPDEAFHKELNVTLIGKHLAEKLEHAGVDVIFEERKIQDELINQDLTYADSYRISREYAEETLEQYHDSMKMIFDIHRDTIQRDQTTLNLNGEEVARIVFIVSEHHSAYEQNLAFATKLHERLDEKYPGLSRGVLLKRNQTFNQNTYNQDLLAQSLLLDIGGLHNSMEEVKRATDYLSEVILEILQEE